MSSEEFLWEVVKAYWTVLLLGKLVLLDVRQGPHEVGNCAALEEAWVQAPVADVSKLSDSQFAPIAS